MISLRVLPVQKSHVEQAVQRNRLTSDSRFLNVLVDDIENVPFRVVCDEESWNDDLLHVSGPEQVIYRWMIIYFMNSGTDAANPSYRSRTLAACLNHLRGVKRGLARTLLACRKQKLTEETCQVVGLIILISVHSMIHARAFCSLLADNDAVISYEAVAEAIARVPLITPTQLFNLGQPSEVPDAKVPNSILKGATVANDDEAEIKCEVVVDESVIKLWQKNMISVLWRQYGPFPALFKMFGIVRILLDDHEVSTDNKDAIMKCLTNVIDYVYLLRDAVQANLSDGEEDSDDEVKKEETAEE